MNSPDIKTAQEIIGKAKALFLDLDGTLYRGNKVIPGATSWVKQVQDQGKKVFFLSNNSSKSTREYLPKLYDLGFDISPSEIWNSLNATLAYLAKRKLKRIFVVGTPSVCEEFEHNDFIIDDQNPDAVVLTYDTTFNYQKWERAHQLLNNGAQFIATHPDLLCPTEEGFAPDLGCLLAAFKAGGHEHPTIIGKPYSTMIETLLEKLEINAEEAVMMGDRLYTDIRLGFENNIPSILTLTGESQLIDLKNSPWQPCAIIPSVKDLIN